MQWTLRSSGSRLLVKLWWYTFSFTWVMMLHPSVAKPESFFTSKPHSFSCFIYCVLDVAFAQFKCFNKLSTVMNWVLASFVLTSTNLINVTSCAMFVMSHSSSVRRPNQCWLLYLLHNIWLDHLAEKQEHFPHSTTRSMLKKLHVNLLASLSVRSSRLSIFLFNGNSSLASQ